jgi:hypothetical protein
VIYDHTTEHRAMSDLYQSTNQRFETSHGHGFTLMVSLSLDAVDERQLGWMLVRERTLPARTKLRHTLVRRIGVDCNVTTPLQRTPSLGLADSSGYREAHFVCAACQTLSRRFNPG